MTSPTELLALIEEEIKKFRGGSEPIELYEPISYFIDLGGKRIRPILVMMGCELFGGDPKESLASAHGIELFHNFTLLHDDIMDKSPVRRNKPTVHTKWNESVAILSGDAMFVQATQRMMQTPEGVRNNVMRIFLDNALKVCEGQQYDMNFENSSVVSLEQYLKMIELKTAVLLGASLQIGALIGGGGQKSSQLLYEFGKHLGIAFQIQDDMLDVYGDEQVFGKEQGRDIVTNKKTYLLLKTFELASSTDQSLLRNLMQESTMDSREKVGKVMEMYEKYSIRTEVSKRIESHFSECHKIMDEINLPAEHKAYLMNFAETLQKRAK